MDEERYGVAELADAADVSVRTVRYYIAEGLLPPAVTAGARSYYTREHLDRLRVIGRMKDAFLPLKEIRRQLAVLDEEAIRQIADDAVVEEADLDAALLPFDAADASERSKSARRYDAPAPEASRFIHGHEDIHSSPPRPAPPPEQAEQTPRSTRPSPASEYIARVLGRPARPGQEQRHGHGARPRRAPAPDPAAEPIVTESAADYRPPQAHHAPEETVAWRRIAIGDDAELLIREEAYHRRREKIDWLIDWARKVLD